MPGCQLDHITITAPDLASGMAFVRETLGVIPQAGGRHPRMGTHNCLLKLGEATFLEVIAPDPEAAVPGRPRWFGLDTLAAGVLPRLATWVARTDDIREALAGCSEFLGDIEPMSRGDLNWRITIPPDGSLPCQGVAPTLIEWPSGSHPAAGLRDQGCSLLGVELFHPDVPRLEALLESIGFAGDVTVSTTGDNGVPTLVAHIATPSGRRHIGGPVVHEGGLRFRSRDV